MESDIGRRMEELQQRMRNASVAFLEAAQSNLSKANLVAGGRGPNYINGGWGDEIKFYIHRIGNNNPQVGFGCRIHVVQNKFVLQYHLGEDSPVEYYSGHTADEESLVEATRRAGIIVNLELPKRFIEKLENVYSNDQG